MTPVHNLCHVIQIAFSSQKINVSPDEVRKVLNEHNSTDPLAIAYRLILDQRGSGSSGEEPIVDYEYKQK